MYRDAIEAFETTLFELGGKGEATIPCRITRLTSPEVRLANGIRYCFVEVTSGNGDQFGVEAFDDEADRLYRSASRIRDGRGAPLLPLLVSA